MKLKFDSGQKYQLDAIKSVTDLFEGQPPHASSFTYDFYEGEQKSLIAGVANRLVLGEEQVVENLHTVQQRNEIQLSEKLEGMNFTVEMETGTGKTYVYLRTIYELNSLYRFSKFVIVVPSVAIREGVLKNLQITHEHFQELYDSAPVNF